MSRGSISPFFKSVGKIPDVSDALMMLVTKGATIFTDCFINPVGAGFWFRLRDELGYLINSYFREVVFFYLFIFFFYLNILVIVCPKST